MGGFPAEPFIGKTQVPHPAVSSLLDGRNTLRRIDEVGFFDSQESCRRCQWTCRFSWGERKQVPGDVLRDAERLECLPFAGFDPYFLGDEPPGL